MESKTKHETSDSYTRKEKMQINYKLFINYL